MTRRDWDVLHQTYGPQSCKYHPEAYPKPRPEPHLLGEIEYIDGRTVLVRLGLPWPDYRAATAGRQEGDR